MCVCMWCVCVNVNVCAHKWVNILSPVSNLNQMYFLNNSSFFYKQEVASLAAACQSGSDNIFNNFILIWLRLALIPACPRFILENGS